MQGSGGPPSSDFLCTSRVGIPPSNKSRSGDREPPFTTAYGPQNPITGSSTTTVMDMRYVLGMRGRYSPRRRRQVRSHESLCGSRSDLQQTTPTCCTLFKTRRGLVATTIRPRNEISNQWVPKYNGRGGNNRIIAYDCDAGD